MWLGFIIPRHRMIEVLCSMSFSLLCRSYFLTCLPHSWLAPARFSDEDSFNVSPSFCLKYVDDRKRYLCFREPRSLDVVLIIGDLVFNLF